MKTFKFHARNGQAAIVCRLIIELVGIKPTTTQTNKGIMIRVLLPEHISKRAVDRFLYARGVPGASQRKRPPIIKAEPSDVWDIRDKLRSLGLDEDSAFTLANNGKLRRARITYYDFGCDCCRGYHRLQFAGQ